MLLTVFTVASLATRYDGSSQGGFLIVARDAGGFGAANEAHSLQQPVISHMLQLVIPSHTPYTCPILVYLLLLHVCGSKDEICGERFDLARWRGV